MKAPFVGTVVWGDSFCDLFERWHFPSLVMAGLDQLGSDLKIFLYTTAESRPRLERLISEEFYRGYNFAIVEIPKEVFHAKVTVGKNPSELKKVCQYELANRAWDADVPFIFTYPDHIYAPGSFLAVRQRADEGYRAIYSNGFVVRVDLIDDDRRAEMLNSSAHPIRWGAQLLDILHPWTTRRLWSSPEGSRITTNWPCYLYALEKQGLFTNAFHSHPIYIHQRRRVGWSPHGMEGDFVELADISFEDCILIDDGSFLNVGIDMPGKETDVTFRPPLAPGTYMSDDQLADWVKISTMRRPYYQRRFAPITVPLAIREGYELDDCREVMERLSKRIQRVVDRVESQGS